MTFNSQYKYTICRLFGDQSHIVRSDIGDQLVNADDSTTGYRFSFFKRCCVLR